MAADPSSSRRFCIALSFPGEHRAYVEQVANALLSAFGGGEEGKARVFYDAWHEAHVIGYGTSRKLQKIYAKDSDLIVPFYCQDYMNKKWCGVELRAIEDLLFDQQYDRVLPFRFDMVEIPNSFKTDVFPVVTERLAEDIARLILERYNELQQTTLELSTSQNDQQYASFRAGSSVPRKSSASRPTVAVTTDVWQASFRIDKERILDAIERDLPGNIFTSVRMSVEPGTSPSNQAQPVGWKDIQAKEAEHIRERRSAASQPISNDNLVGLSFSGGGIRAATFALGVIQRLAKQNLLPHVDYLSTVSGGGFCGSFLSSYLNSSDPDVGLESGKIPLDKTITGVESAALRHIRNHSKYLSYGGAWRNLQIAGLGLIGVLINLAVMLPILVLIVVASEKLMGLSQVIKQSQPPPMFANPVVVRLWCLMLLSTLGCGAFVSLVLRNSEKGRIQNPDPTRSQETQYGRRCLTMLGVFLFMTLMLVWPTMVWFVANTLQHMEPINLRVIGILSSPFLLCLAITFAPSRNWLKSLMILFALSVPLATLTAYFVLFFHFIVQMPDSGYGVLAMMFVLPVLYSYFLLDVNFNSPHAFYRNRLVDAYLIKPSTPWVEVVDHQKLTDLRSQRKEIPYHLINGALNAQASRNPNLRGRQLDFFLFSQAFCGSPLSGYFPTSEFEKLDSHLDLGTAMAISGAVASPNMGALTDDKARFWLTILNLRPGYWLKNPRSADKSRWPGLRYLFREMRGDLAEDTPYINVSDGGHLENLALYELLRRQCKFIIAIDGEADPQMECASLMEFLRLVEVDFGIKVSISPMDFELQSTGYSKAAFTVGIIDYGPSLTNPADVNDRRLGVLIYLKNTLTGTEPPQLREYAKRNPSFPHVSVIDQLFDEKQFESFRSLGYHVASQALANEIFDGQVPHLLNVKSWTRQLVESIDSD